MSENVWKKFYRIESKLSHNSGFDAWKELIGRGNGRNMCMQFFALARYEMENGEPLNLEAARRTAREIFGFEYDFTTYRDILQCGLNFFGVDLIKAGNGFQYLRTIHRLSGAIYLKVAKKIRQSNIPCSRWFDENGLSNELISVINPYITAGDDPTEDVVGFLRRMKSRYERYYTFPTVDQCAHEENEISRGIVKKVLEKLNWNNNESTGNSDSSQVSVSDTMPCLSLDEKCQLVAKIHFQNPTFNVDNEATTICFSFNNTEGDIVSVARFYYYEGCWRSDVVDNNLRSGIPIDKFSSIQKTVWKEKKLLESCEVTPLILRDPDYDHVLFQVEMATGVVQVRRLHEVGSLIPSCAWFFVAPLNGAIPSVSIHHGEVVDGVVEVGTPFQIPADADVLRVGDFEYQIKTKASEWIDLSSFRWTGARLFCEKSQFPFSDDLVDASDVKVFYRKTTREEFEFSKEIGQWIIDDSILWDKGWVVFKEKENKELTKRAITFIPDIDDSGINQVFPVEQSAKAAIKFGSESVDVPILPLKTKVLVHIHGFSNFYFSVKRKGMYFRVPGVETLIPISTDKNIRTEIAVSDFEKGLFYFISDGDDNVCIEGAEIKSVKSGKLCGGDLKSLVGEPSDGNWTVSVGEIVCYFHVYAPDRTPVNCECQHPVRWWQQGDDLVVQFWMAHRWRNKDLTYIFYPAHRQDLAPVIWQDVKVSFDSDNRGRLFPTATIKGLYSEISKVDWGCGLLAFMGYDKGNGGYQSVSSGFFVKAEESEQFQMGQDEDPYGLRVAMARCDVPNIERIMQTDDSKCRDWIRDFENKTLRALDKIGALEYFHAYKSNCLDANGTVLPSGYFFMAGWLLIEKIGEQLHEENEVLRWFRIQDMIRKDFLPENYKGKWSSLLISDQFFPSELFSELEKSAANVLKVRNELTLNDSGPQRNWTSCCTFNDHMVKQLIPRLFGIIDRVKKEFPIQGYNPVVEDETFMNFGGDFNGRGNAAQLEECVSRLAKWVAEWRKKPSLKDAQSLRDILLDVHRLDDEIKKKIKEFPKSEDGDDSKEWVPRYSIIQRIALKADYFRSI